MTGAATGGKPINLTQLTGELQTAGVDLSAGLGTSADTELATAPDYVFTYADGEPADWPAAEQTTVDQVIADHVAMRDKTDVEYSAEFQNPETTVARKQQIRDQMNGLEPREQVPMT